MPAHSKHSVLLAIILGVYTCQSKTLKCECGVAEVPHRTVSLAISLRPIHHMEAASDAISQEYTLATTAVARRPAVLHSPFSTVCQASYEVLGIQ